MCDIKNLSGLACDKKTPGNKVDIYYSPIGEHTGRPQTVAELNSATPENIVQGDTMRLGEPFDFTGAASGLGYWRKLTCILDTAKIEAILQGEVGSYSFDNMIDFEVSGVAAEQLEFAVALKNCCEGFTFMVPTKDGEHLVIGEPGLPVFPVSNTLSTGAGSGDKKAGVYQLKVNSSVPFYHYDAATHGIEITPNS